jgi:hypothetical protein
VKFSCPICCFQSTSQSINFLPYAIVIRVFKRLVMKFITFELSNRTLTATTISQIDGLWDCSILLSQQCSTYGQVIYKHARSFSGFYSCDDVLKMAVDFTSCCIENCNPE